MVAKLITFEGLDGAGKTTHIAWFHDALRLRGVRLCMTREPGGTPLGEALRKLLLDPAEGLHPEAETLLVFAARREHLAKVIRPALEAGTWVLCDRFTDATFAYQGGGSGVAWSKIEALEAWAQQGLQPDLTLYFDVDPRVARSRARAARTPDRFEREQEAFHTAVRAGYLRRLSESGGRMRRIDANQAVDAIQVELEEIVEVLCSKSGSDQSGRS
jgi:dTMP kinase